MSLSENDILNALRQVQEPELHKDLVTLNMIRDLKLDGNNISFSLMLTTPACPLRGQIQEEAKQAVLKVPGVQQVDVTLSSEVNRDNKLFESKILPGGVKNIIAVASGKGGVGKSTTAVNLAVALQRSGARVGLIDADIYGPNIPMMMGLLEKDRPSVNAEQKLIPLENYGVKVISIGFL